LLRIIPLLTSDAVDTADEVYQATLFLRSVTELVMAPNLTVGQVATMNVLNEDYLERKHCLFLAGPLRQKHHFMTHYAKRNLQFGLLIKLWTMCFESKQLYFKRCICSGRNFVNVGNMLAHCHQLHQAYLSAASPRLACDTDVSHVDLVVGVRAEQVFCAPTIKGTYVQKRRSFAIQDLQYYKTNCI